MTIRFSSEGGFSGSDDLAPIPENLPGLPGQTTPPAWRAPTTLSAREAQDYADAWRRENAEPRIITSGPSYVYGGVSYDDLVAALAALSGPEDDAPRDVALQVKLTEAENRRLRTTAASDGARVQRLARDAFRAFGLI